MDEKFMSDLKDPRVLFAAERTLLAWNRTSIGLIAFGHFQCRGDKGDVMACPIFREKVRRHRLRFGFFFRRQ